MNLVVFTAWRYFKAKKSVQAINIIAWISMSAIAVSAAAMIILFSVFNGLDNVIKDYYTFINPEIKITPLKGKFFQLPAAQKEKLAQIPGVAVLSETIQDMALLSNESGQQAGLVKGVDNNWFAVSGLDSLLLEGKARWPQQNGKTVPAMLGLGIANNLSIDVTNPFSELQIFYPKPHSNSMLNPQQSLSRMIVRPSGLFRVQQVLGGRYVLIPLTAAQKLFGEKNKIAAIEIATDGSRNIRSVQKDAAKVMGATFRVENRFQQNKTLYMVMSGEKWIVYAVLLLVLLIASFNLTGSLYMLVLEKKKDISILKTMGMSRDKLRQIFLAEGVLLALVGAVAGIVIGSLVCLGQLYFGWVRLPPGFSIPSYPVAFHWQDFLLVFGTSVFIGIVAAWYPALKAGRQADFFREE